MTAAKPHEETDMSMYRIWFENTPIDEQPRFRDDEIAEYADRFEFDASLVKPGCDIDLCDEFGKWGIVDDDAGAES